jgi:hypothetical protein
MSGTSSQLCLPGGAPLPERLRAMARGNFHPADFRGTLEEAAERLELLEREVHANPDARSIQFRGIDNTFAPYTGPIGPGMRFEWERDKPHARCTVTVTRVVKRPHADTQVYTQDDRFVKAPREVWNDESRFREAVVPL